MRVAVAFGTLALAAGGPSVTVLPRPAFAGPSTWTPYAPRHLSLVSSRKSPSGLEIHLPMGRPFHGLPLQRLFKTENRVFAL
jgi:hypothetical protein